MPFKKRGRYYVSPSGRRFTKGQVRAYYAKMHARRRRVSRHK